MDTGASDDKGPPERPERVVDVALAEFEALRAEIVNSRTIQSAFIGVGFTAIGLIFAFALQKHGSLHVLLVVPPFSFVISIIYLAESVRMRRFGDYIRLHIWPQLQKSTGYPCSWEGELFKQVKTRDNIMTETLFGGVVPLLFAAIGAVALLYAPASDVLAVVGWIAVILTLAIPVIFSYTVLKRPN